jgi:ABC-type uncharacterized transport system ATPase subunit
MLLCTHNLAEAEALCERVIILREGRVAVHGAIAELRASAGRRVLLRAREGIARLRDALGAEGYAAEEEGDALAVRLADVEAGAPALLRALLARGIEVFECRVVEPSLEEIFFRHLGPAVHDAKERAS